MSTPQLQQDDVGVVFLITVVDQAGAAVDLSGATTISFIFQKPDDTLLVGTGTLATDGTDGKIQYEAEAGDLDVAGTWRYQTHVVIGGLSLYSTVIKFKVLQNLPR